MNDQRLSLAEILAALSHALDLTEGQPSGHTIRSCMIGMRLGEALGLTAERRASLYYALLLKDAGCSANASPVADLFGTHDHRVKRNFKTTDWARFVPAAMYGIRNAGRGRPLAERMAEVAKLGLAGPDAGRALVRIRCERGAAIIRSLGFPQETADAVYSLDEHWNGAGHPDGLEGEAIPELARIASVAQTTEVFLAERGRDEAMAMLSARRGRWFEPALADEVRSWAQDDAWWALLDGPEVDAALLDAEPDDHVRAVDADGLDRVAEAFAEIIDAKSPFTSRHSRGVAEYAVAIAKRLGLPDGERRQLYRAGLLHDIGKLGISSRILDKPGALTPDERAQIQRHPVYGWAILKRVRAFRPFAWSAVLHHERLDGTGYPWGVPGEELDVATRILCVADVFEALTARRPYREPMPATAAMAILWREADKAFDRTMIEALEAAELGGAEDVMGAA